jgi:hypothetical protein
VHAEVALEIAAPDPADESEALGVKLDRLVRRLAVLLLARKFACAASEAQGLVEQQTAAHVHRLSARSSGRLDCI